MLRRTRWRVVEEPCARERAPQRWRQAAAAGALGAVTSWGSGILGREAIRLYWEASEGAAVPEGEDLIEENWTPYWRESLRTVRVSPSVALVPAWEPEVPEVPCALRIDPGMAFGSGDHPTTRLCLQLIETLSEAGRLPRRVLDAGAGTGVLALAAARLGCPDVDALDIDPFGFAACRRNARLNGLEGSVRPRLLSLDLLDETYSLIVANIVVTQLVHLSTYLRARVETGGMMLLSGFSKDAEAPVRERVLGPWAVSDRREEEGWIALLAEAR